MLHQVAQVEDIILLQIEAATTLTLVDQLPAVHHTIDHLEQLQALDPLPLTEEVDLQGLVPEIHQVDLPIHPTLAAQADLVLAVP